MLAFNVAAFADRADTVALSTDGAGGVTNSETDPKLTPLTFAARSRWP